MIKESSRIFDILDRYNLIYNNKSDALIYKKNKEWLSYTPQEFINYVNWLSYGLHVLGTQKGDKIISISNNRPEFNFLDFALQQLGAIHVPVYPTLNNEEYKYIFMHSEARAIFISDQTLYNKIKPIADEVENIEVIFSFNDINGVRNWMEIARLGRMKEKEIKNEVKIIKDSILPSDIFTMIYTSGTTGIPKGVILTHTNMLSNVKGIEFIMPLTSDHRSLSFLPLCHVYERMLNYNAIYKGITVCYAENIGTIAQDAASLKVDGFCCVPRVLENIHDKLISKGKDLTGIKKKIYFWAVRLGYNFREDGSNSIIYKRLHKIADKLVYSKWREALGGNLKIVVSGGSALQPRLARLFWAANIRICEGYGLTETSPVIAVNYTYYPNVCIGTVGPLLEGVECKIAEDGEILVKGPNITPGYFKDDVATAAIIDSDGWFHTGDIGIFVNKKFLKITDRKKEMFKLSVGKYIAPQAIENRLKESELIEQVMVVGSDEKFAAAIISPNFNYLHFWASKHKIHYRNNEELIANKDVTARLEKEVNKVNSTLSPHEHIKKIRLVIDEWTPNTGELTPTLKLKRNILMKRYTYLVKDIYGHDIQSDKMVELNTLFGTIKIKTPKIKLNLSQLINNNHKDNQ